MAFDGLDRGRGDGWLGWRGDGEWGWDSGLFLRSRWPLQSSYSRLKLAEEFAAVKGNSVGSINPYNVLVELLNPND